MYYQVILNTGEQKSIYASCFVEAYMFALCLYGKRAIGSIIFLDEETVRFCSLSDYQEKIHWVDDDELARMLFEIARVRLSNLKKYQNETLQPEQEQRLTTTYEIYHIIKDLW